MIKCQSQKCLNYQDTDRVIKVFDLDVQQLRAFRLENLIKFDIDFT